MFIKQPNWRTAAATRGGVAERGFALVVALALMGFLLLLLVGLAALVQVETRRGASDLELLKARQNALFGLKVALSQLQREAGPDQRVTARADILTTDSAELGSGKRYWTGVWPTDGTVANADPVWLVSQRDGVPDPLEPWNESAATVQLLGANDNGNRVQAETVPITAADEQAGSYAFWIGDEGIKAKVNIAVETGTAPAANRYTSTTSRRFGLELIPGLEEIGDAFSGGNDAADGFDVATLARIHNRPHIELLSPTIAAATPGLVHDITPHAYGVLANARDGGLRRDLTVRLSGEAELEGLLWEYPDYDGPSWELLRRYFKMVEQTAEFAVDEVPRLPLQRAHIAEQLNLDLNWGSHLSYPTSPALMPIIAWMGMTAGAFAATEFDPDDPDSRTYRLHVSMKPVVVLWNPYDVTIDSDIGYVVNLVASNSGAAHLAPKFFLENTYASDESGRVHLASLLPNHPEDPGSQSNLRYLGPRFSIEPTDLLPGEVAVFTLPPGTAEPYEFLTPDDVSEDLFDSDPSLARGGPVLQRGFRPAPFVSVPIHDGNTTYNPGAGNSGWFVVDADMGQVKFGVDGLPPEGSEPPELRFAQPRSGRLFLAFDHGQLYFEASPTTGANHRLGRQHKMVSNNSVMISAGSGFEATFASAAALESLLMNGQPVDFSSWAVALTTPQLSVERSLKLIGEYNIRVAHSGGSNLNWITPAHLGSVSPIYTGITAGGMHVDPFDPLSGEEGGSILSLSALREVTLDDSTSRTIGPILFHVPRHEIVSIGQLMHLDLARSVWNPTYTVGNSMASPWIESNQLLNTDGSYPISDQSYMANEALWDSYFFSTIRALPDPPINSRLHYLAPAPATTANRELQAAAALLVDGQFNINSTSVDAWKAVLGGLNQAQLDFSDLVNEESTMDTKRLENPFPRSAYHSLFGAVGSKPDNPSTDDWPLEFESWNSVPELSGEKIDQLARRIVFELRHRGRPFASLAAFINREPDFPSASSPAGSRNPRMMGILQRALNANYTEDDELDGEGLRPGPINSAGDQVDPSAINHVYPEAALGLLAEGVPGYVMQADILQAIGPIIAARSDTFVIRAYGDANGSGPATTPDQPSSRAWCEAVVQRLPDYIDDADEAHQVPLPDSINDRFGRRFRVVSFRWLTPDEI